MPSALRSQPQIFQKPGRLGGRQTESACYFVGRERLRGEHLALIGVGGPIPLPDFETDAAIYNVVGNTLHLAGLTMLKAKIGAEMREIFSSKEPVNLLLDCETGKGQIEVRQENNSGTTTMLRMVPGLPASVPAEDTGWQAASGTPAPTTHTPGRQPVVLAQAGELPKPAASVEALWNRSKPPQAGTTDEKNAREVFTVKPAPARLQRPLKRLTSADIASTPRPNDRRNSYRMWNSTDNLQGHVYSSGVRTDRLPAAGGGEQARGGSRRTKSLGGRVGGNVGAGQPG